MTGAVADNAVVGVTPATDIVGTRVHFPVRHISDSRRPTAEVRFQVFTDIDGRERYEVGLYALTPLVAEREAGAR